MTCIYYLNGATDASIRQCQDGNDKVSKRTAAQQTATDSAWIQTLDCHITAHAVHHELMHTPQQYTLTCCKAAVIAAGMQVTSYTR